VFNREAEEHASKKAKTFTPGEPMPAPAVKAVEPKKPYVGPTAEQLTAIKVCASRTFLVESLKRTCFNPEPDVWQFGAVIV